MRHRRPAESLSSPRSRSAPSANPRAAWGWWTQACAQWGGEGAAPSHRGRSGRAKVLPSLRTRVLPPALFRSVTQITVWGLGPCGGVGRRRGRAAEGVTAIGTGCAADSAPTGGGDEEGWLLTQPQAAAVAARLCLGAPEAKPHYRVADWFGVNRIKTLPPVGAMPTLGDSSVWRPVGLCSGSRGSWTPRPEAFPSLLACVLGKSEEGVDRLKHLLNT